MCTKNWDISYQKTAKTQDIIFVKRAKACYYNINISPKNWNNAGT